MSNSALYPGVEECPSFSGDGLVAMELIPGDYDGDGDDDMIQLCSKDMIYYTNMEGQYVKWDGCDTSYSNLPNKDCSNNAYFRNFPGDSQYYTPITILEQSYSGTAGDVDNDGDIDFFLVTEWGIGRMFLNLGPNSNRGPQEDVYFLNQGAAYIQNTVSSAEPHAKFADFNGDGRLDIIYSSHTRSEGDFYNPNSGVKIAIQPTSHDGHDRSNTHSNPPWWNNIINYNIGNLLNLVAYFGSRIVPLDVDNDGDMDLIMTYSSESGYFSAYPNNQFPIIFIENNGNSTNPTFECRSAAVPSYQGGSYYGGCIGVQSWEDPFYELNAQAQWSVNGQGAGSDLMYRDPIAISVVPGESDAIKLLITSGDGNEATFKVATNDRGITCASGETFMIQQSCPSGNCNANVCCSTLVDCEGQWRMPWLFDPLSCVELEQCYNNADCSGVCGFKNDFCEGLTIQYTTQSCAC